MFDDSKVDLFCESIMRWATTGRIIEDLYFTIRHYLFHSLVAINCTWLPFIRQVEKQLKPHSVHLYPQYTWRERLGLGFINPFSMFFTPFLIVVIFTAVIDLPSLTSIKIENLADSKAILSNYLKTIATLLTTLTALLLAVITLTIQTKTLNLTGGDFLRKALIRKQNFLPVAAFLLGTILTALMGIILSERFSIKLLNDYTCVTVFLSFVSILILFNLLRRTMQTLDTSDFDQLLSTELISSLRMSFSSALKRELFEKYFSIKLAELGFAGLYTAEKQDKHPTEYKLKKLGSIVAIDPAPLKRISQILKLKPIHYERNISLLPLDRQEDETPYITVQPNEKITKNNQLAMLTNEMSSNKHIAQLIQKSFIIQKKYNSKFNWQQIRQIISSAITKDESTTVTTVANVLTDIFEDYLEAQEAVAGRGNLVLEDFIGSVVYDFKPPHPFNLRFSELVVYAFWNHHQDCLDEMLNCNYKLAQISFIKQNEKYFRDWIFEFYWAYHSSGLYVKEQNLKIAPHIMRRMHWLSDILSSDIYGYENSIERIHKISQYTIDYFSLCLWMLKTASERYDQSTFDAVIEHLINFFKYKLKKIKFILDVYHKGGAFFDIPYELKIKDNTTQENLLREYERILDYKNLVYLIIGAWLIHKLKNEELKSEQISYFIDKIMENSPNFRDLLDLFAMPGMADMTISHDNPLGFDGWDLPKSRYSNVIRGTDFSRWISPFYQFILLRKGSQFNPTYVDINSIHKTEMASHEMLKIYLNEISSESYELPDEYKEKPWSMESKDLETAKKQIQRLLESWPEQ